LRAREELCGKRAGREKELKAEGKKVIGYFCCYTPLEIITAAGLISYRITGNTKEPTTVVHATLSLCQGERDEG